MENEYPKTASTRVPRAHRQEGSWTIKSRLLSPDLRNAVAIAARRAGKTQGDWLAERLWAVVRAELHEGSPSASLPATLTDVQQELTALREQASRDKSELMELIRQIATKPAPEKAPEREPATLVGQGVDRLSTAVRDATIQLERWLYPQRHP